MWRDETQAWATVLSSSSFGQLFENLRYTGQGSLWYVLLYGLSRVTDQPVAMQLLHLLLAGAVAGLLLFRLPVPRLHRVLLAFGYFPFFEYATISRSYALAFLLVMGFCAVAASHPDALLGQALLLFLLAQTTTFGWWLAIVLALYPLAAMWPRLRSGKLSRNHRRRALLALLLFEAGLTLALLQLIPPPDSGFAAIWSFRPELGQLGQALASLWRGLVPVPLLQDHFWNTNFLDSSQPAQAVLGAGLWCLWALLLSRRPRALLVFVASWAGFLFLVYRMQSGFLRHAGHFFVALLAAYWLWTVSPERPFRSAFWDRFVAALERRRHGLLLILAAAHLFAGVYANVLDWLRPFSVSKIVAGFIAREAPRAPVLGDRDYIAAAVAAHLNRPFYYPRGRRSGTMIIWDLARIPRITPDRLAAETQGLLAASGQDALLVLSYPLRDPPANIREIARFPPGIVRDEEYFLYRAHHVPGSP